MNLTKSKTAKFVAGIVGLAMAVTFLSPTGAGAQTTTDLQAQIAALLAQIAQLQGLVGQGSGVTGTAPMAPLTVGSSGAEVTKLQNFLISKGFGIAAGATGYFGAQTKAALAAFQSANGVSPAVGYYGPITAAKVASMMTPVVVTPTPGTPPTPTPGGPLQGGAGSVESYKLISGLTSEKVGEDEEDVDVAGIEVEVDDGSDIQITAVKLVFDEGTAGSDFEEYASEVSIWLDGKEIARADGEDFNDDNEWTKTVTTSGSNIIKAGEIGDLVVAVSGVSNLDSGDAADTWTVDFRQVRYVDATGASTSEDPGTATRTFSFETFATATNAELKIKKDNDDVNDAHVINVHATADTDNVSLLSFTLEAEGDSDLFIDKLSASTTATGATNVSDLVKNFSLWIDGVEYGTASSSNPYVVFEDMNFTLEAGDKVEAVIKGDFNSVADDLDEGDTILLTTGFAYGTHYWDVEDESNQDLVAADVTGTASAEAHAVYDKGINVDFVSANQVNDNASGGYSGADDTGVYTIVFDVTAFDADIYIDGDPVATSTSATLSLTNAVDGESGILWATTTASTATTLFDVANASGGHLGLNQLTCADPESDDVNTSGAKTFVIRQDDTRRCTLSINFGPVVADVNAGLRLRGISWDTENGDVHDTVYRFDMGAYETNTIQLINS